VAITPDDKDWTWVLERPCPQCGFDASTRKGTDLGHDIRETAESWRQVMSRRDVGKRPAEDRWSPLEYGCHVRDLFKVFDRRLVLMLSEDNPTFENWDQDATAAESNYEAQDPGSVSKELSEAASVLAGRFDGVEEGQWERPGTRSNGSLFTVESLGLYLIHDPVHHLWDVSGVEVPESY
jgi:DinB superfamily